MGGEEGREGEQAWKGNLIPRVTVNQVTSVPDICEVYFLGTIVQNFNVS